MIDFLHAYAVEWVDVFDIITTSKQEETKNK